MSIVSDYGGDTVDPGNQSGQYTPSSAPKQMQQALPSQERRTVQDSDPGSLEQKQLEIKSTVSDTPEQALKIQKSSGLSQEKKLSAVPDHKPSFTSTNASTSPR